MKYLLFRSAPTYSRIALRWLIWTYLRIEYPYSLRTHSANVPNWSDWTYRIIGFVSTFGILFQSAYFLFFIVRLLKFSNLYISIFSPIYPRSFKNLILYTKIFSFYLVYIWRLNIFSIFKLINFSILRRLAIPSVLSQKVGFVLEQIRTFAMERTSGETRISDSG